MRTARRILLLTLSIAWLMTLNLSEAKKPNNPGGGDGSAAYSILPFMPPDIDTTSSFVLDLNDEGEAVGNAILPDGGSIPLHLDIATGAYTTLEKGDQGTTKVYGVNNLSQLVGITADGQGNVDGLFWSNPSAAPIVLPPLPGDIKSFAHAINDASLVAGYSINAEDVKQGAVWRVCVDDDGTVHVDDPVALSPLAGGSDSSAVDITEILDGSALVTGKTSNPFEEAAVWIIEVNPVDGTIASPDPPVGLGSLDGLYSLATKMNNLGDVVGESDNSPVVAVSGEGFQLLPMPRKTLGGRAEDANDFQEIVGQLLIKSFPSDAWGTPTAYLWSNGEPIDLNKQIDSNIGWGPLWNANVINNAGIIGGWGEFDVTDRGFLLILN